VRAVEQIAGLLDSDDERIRLEAAKVILDRAYGRPPQSTELKIEAGDVMAEHLAALLERAQARRALREGGTAVLVGEGRAS
jgi:hypothetical protein